MRSMGGSPDSLRTDELPAAFGRYRLLSLLGEGGMARVFRAELLGDEGFRKPTAIKVIHAAVAARGEALKRALINEARTGGLLHHPNIVDVYDFGEVDGQPYIAMELVRGVGLDALLRVGRLEPARALEVGAQIAAGLDHAHHLEVDGQLANLVHRDLKPSNVILSRDGLVKVMDFGIAKAATNAYATTETGMTKGTPSYMSPEQAAGDALDRRSDLFALGALLYEMVTGRRYFDGENMMSVLLAVVQVEERLDDGRIDALDEVVPGLADVVRRCLRKDPVARWDSAGDVEFALRGLLRAVPPPEVPLRRWVRQLLGDGPTDAQAATARWSGASEPVVARGGTVASGAPGGPAVAPTATRAPAPPAVDPTRLVPASQPRMAATVEATLDRRAVAPRKDRTGLLLALLGIGLLLVAVGLFFWRSRASQRPTAVAVPLAPASEPDDVVPPDESAESDESVEPDGPATAGRDIDDPEPEPPKPDRREDSPVPAPVTGPAERPERVVSEPTTPRPPPREDGPALREDRSVRAAPAPAAFGIASASAREVSRDADGVVVRFSARIPAATDGATVTAFFNPPKARWVERPLRPAGGDLWAVDVTFPWKSVGKTYWYVEARPADGGRLQRFGSEGEPKVVRLRR